VGCLPRVPGKSAEEGKQKFFFGAENLGEDEWGMSETHVFE